MQSYVSPNVSQSDLAAQGEAIDRLLKRQLNRCESHPSENASQEAHILAQTAKALGPRGQGHGVLAQINPTPGDLAGNARIIMAWARAAEAIGADWIAFPELALMGYPIGDVITRHPFLVTENLRWLRALTARAGQTRLLVGFVEPRAYPGGKPFYNALAVLGDGRIEAIVRKSLLPAYGEFYDTRTFEPAPRVGALSADTLGSTGWETENAGDAALWTIHGKRYGLSICEDIWNDGNFFARPLYLSDPIAALAAQEPDLLLNVSASPSRSRKEALKHHMLASAARKYGRPLAYVNQTGAVDELSFDGASRVYDAQGHLVARARAFQEQFLIVRPLQRDPDASHALYALPAGLDAAMDAPKMFDAHDESDLARTAQTLTQGIRDYFAKTGFSRAVLGLSGGLDSSVVAALLVDALGPDNVLGVSMPSALTSIESRNDARQLASNLGARFVEISIETPVSAFEAALMQARPTLNRQWGARDEASFSADNLQAMSRASILRALGNDFRALPIATSDKSELYLGYATVNGDMSGALAPLGDVPKTKVRALARWLNANRPDRPNALPLSVIEKPSGAELAIDPATGRALTAEDALMPYAFADEIIWRLEALGQSRAEMRDVEFQWERENALSPEQKRMWLDRFFSRMSASVFKWWLAPPILLVEGNGSITKTDYRHPITAGRICWAGVSDPECAAHLDAPILYSPPSAVPLHETP